MKDRILNPEKVGDNFSFYQYLFIKLYRTIYYHPVIKTKATNIDEYIAGFPKETQKILQQIRATIRKAAPGAEESISYSIPTFKLDKSYLVYFAAFKNHIGFYPTPGGAEAFKKDLSLYKTGKGSVQFPLDKPMPLDLITKIVKFRVKENAERAEKKKS